MIEALETPLAPILGAELGRWFADLHLDEGVRVMTGAMLEGARGDGRVEELILADGAAARLRRGRGRRRHRARHRLAAPAAASTSAASGSTPPAAPRCPASSPPATPRSPSTPASAPTPAPSTGTPPPGRAPRWPRRCSASTRARRRCRASGATSTGCGSSTSATPTCGDAVVIEGDPAARDFEAVFTAQRRPGRRPRGRPPPRDPGACASESRRGHRSAPDREEEAA